MMMNNYYDFLLIYYMKYGLLLQGQIFQEQGVINSFTFFLLTKYAHEILGFFQRVLQSTYGHLQFTFM